MEPSISVIIPTYNRAALLPRSIESILAQTFQDFEIVVADDGSTDDTGSVLASYGDRLRVVPCEHRGVAAARNAAVAAARGTYVAFHDSDDVAWENRLAVQHEHLAPRSHLGALMCNGAFGEDHAHPWIDRRLARRLEAKGVGLSDVFEHSLALMQAMLFRRTALVQVGGFDESLRLLSDLDFVLRFALRWPIGFVDVSVFTYLQRNDSLTADRLAVREQSLVILDRLVSREPAALRRLGRAAVRRKRAHRYYSLAKHRRWHGDLSGAAEAAGRAVALAPLRPQYRLLRWRLAHERQP